MPENLSYKIVLPENFSLSILKKEISKGGSFVIFPYCISLILGTINLTSKAYFIKHNETIDKYKWKYNLILYFLGWWGVPWGGINTIKNLKINNKGGIDVTKDIMQNIDNKAIQDKKVELKEIYTIFSLPNKSDTKTLKKLIKKDSGKFLSATESLFFAYFINVPEYESTPNVIGILPKRNFEEDSQIIKDALYKSFYKHVHFDFVDLREVNEFNSKLKEQGLQLI